MSLAPKRSEPMKFSMVRELYAIPSSHNSPVRIGNLQWSDADTAEQQSYEQALRKLSSLRSIL
jgi:hypothetical protein